MVKKTVLDSGLVIISEYLPAFPSFALSCSIRGGSRAESIENNGIHHFIEHMLFKGTSKYNLKQIANISDRLGGRMNAFTSKEITQYYMKAIDEKLEESFELIADIVMNSTFPQEEFLKEQSVILQEIKNLQITRRPTRSRPYMKISMKTMDLGILSEVRRIACPTSGEIWFMISIKKIIRQTTSCWRQLARSATGNWFI